MLILQLKANYQGVDGAYEAGKQYPILAITKSDDLDVATDCTQKLMTEHGWGKFNLSKYGTIKGSYDAPKSFGEPKDWKKLLDELGAIYIVYSKQT